MPSCLHADNVESPCSISEQAVLAKACRSASTWASSQDRAVAVQEAGCDVLPGELA